jgi:cell division protein FtsN
MLDADRDLGAPRARDRARAAEPRPALTFYQELTAPLTAPPPPAKGSPPRPAEPLGEYTVQVGAYKLAEPAEALRATLTAAGWDARVVGAELADGVRYRVQVGAYPTRDAARLAAARLAAERGLPTLVTPR